MPSSIPPRAAYSHMTWNTPLSTAHADLLLDQLDVQSGMQVLDLGCGWGELLLRALGGADGATGVGVDTDADALARGRERAAALGLGDRVTFHRAAAAEWTRGADRALCIGSAHALGGTANCLATLARLVPAGGRALVGDGCWERPPTDRARAIFGDEVLALPDLARCATAAGWRVLHLSAANQQEWDGFESSWRAGREKWLLANPSTDQAPQLRTDLDERLAEYLEGYRGVLGFCYLVLAH